MARHIGTRFFVACAVVAISAVAVACNGATEPNAPTPIQPAEPNVPMPIQPAEMVKVSGDGQEGRPGDQLQPIIVAVRDRSGKPVPGVIVRFSVTSGDGVTGGSNPTNGNGEAIALWLLGRHGENTLSATAESEGKPLEVTFRATSVSSGYAGGSFALTSPTSVKLYDGFAGGPYDCVVKSGSLVLSPDGSFEGTGDFVDCSSPYPGGASFSFNVIEAGVYAVSDSTIVLHYFKSNDTAGFFDEHIYVHGLMGVMSEATIVFRSLGVEWRYTRLH